VKLVLFDIDGTILWSDGAGRRAMEGALTDVFGTPGSPGYRYDGKTDRQIVRELMQREGRDDAHIDAHMDTLLAQYVERLRGELASGERECGLLGGVGELLDALEARPDTVLGLLTGNLQVGAAAKLAAVGIDIGRFRVNAFGSDHEHRPELPAIAQRRAQEQLGLQVAGADVVVIGDTPFDISCGRAIGARAIGVATGRYSVAELAEHGPSAVFEDLTDTAAVLAAIHG
jgi:phosphoglycolate phosphatase